MMKWIDAQKVIPFPEILTIAGGNKIIADALTRKGIVDPLVAAAYLNPDLYQPASPYELPGMEKAVNILEQAIKDQTTIGVWGDFDVDGQTSTTLLVSGLKQLGAIVIFHIPVRDTESHGVKVPFLEKFIADGAELLLTCDTGIAENEAVAYAIEKGLKVVITDHHDLPPQLPNANAIINSKMLPEEHPLSSLPGVGVAYKLVEALFMRANREEELSQFLDLVALGIVADVATLKGDARYLVQLGLRELRETKRLGLKSLYKEARIEAVYITEMDIGFGIAPRLNALGRLSDANLIVEFFTTEDKVIAEVTAAQLEGLNERRKAYTKQIFAGAISQIEMNPTLLAHSALVLSNPTWPAGVIGIVASKLVEKYRKPVVMLSAPPDEIARGSARSVEGCDINKAISACKDLLEGFGGHPMAAGMGLKTANIDKFRIKLSKAVFSQVGGKPAEPEIIIDETVNLMDLNVPFFDSLRPLAPFGAGNPALVFNIQNISLVRNEQLGKGGEHRKLIIKDHENNQDQILWFNGETGILPKENFDIAFAGANSFFNKELSTQLTYLDFQVRENSIFQKKPKDIEINDERLNPNIENKVLELIANHEGVIIWDEENMLNQNGLKRWQLGPTDNLILVSSPPSLQVFKEVIQAVNPKNVWVFFDNTGSVSIKIILQKILGMAKFSINKQAGRFKIKNVASAINSTEGIVLLAVEWMVAKGYISKTIDDLGDMYLDGKSEENKQIGSIAQIQADIEWLLKENNMFRQSLVDMEKVKIEKIISSVLKKQ